MMAKWNQQIWGFDDNVSKHWESFILYFHPEISRTNSFLGFLAFKEKKKNTNIVWREHDGIIAKDLL